jgi:hypothetical protein
MNSKILIIIAGLIYIFSPFDLIPDFISIPGWLDDAFILGIILYYLKRGMFPGFLSWLNRFFTTSENRQSHDNEKGHEFDENGGVQTADRNPYEVLGIPDNAGPDEIRAAYRRAVQAYHPDKFSHLGQDFQELAKKRFLEIQNAYEKLHSARTKNRDFSKVQEEKNSNRKESRYNRDFEDFSASGG